MSWMVRCLFKSLKVQRQRGTTSRLYTPDKRTPVSYSSLSTLVKQLYSSPSRKQPSGSTSPSTFHRKPVAKSSPTFSKLPHRLRLYSSTQLRSTKTTDHRRFQTNCNYPSASMGSTFSFEELVSGARWVYNRCRAKVLKSLGVPLGKCQGMGSPRGGGGLGRQTRWTWE